MNPFRTFENIKADYRSYIRTFQKFRNARIGQYVQTQVDYGSGKSHCSDFKKV